MDYRYGIKDFTPDKFWESFSCESVKATGFVNG